MEHSFSASLISNNTNSSSWTGSYFGMSNNFHHLAFTNKTLT
uniref:Uncharacterized protein n=1 Tax=Myoviridae sp. ctgXL3 TaxID=2826681 RepID=A0A8S5QRM0_9CAUD|nr:MAG TPA: hypothetical protein [Myoviridae sp. ctgXL3]